MIRYAIKGMAALGLGWVLLASGPAIASPGGDSPNARQVRAFYDAFNTGHLERLDAIVSVNLVDHTMDFGERPGLPGLKQILKQVRTTTPSTRIAIQDLVVQGDKAIARITVSGVQTVEKRGEKAQKRRFSIAGFDEFRFAKGRIVERWGLWDQTTLQNQLGTSKRVNGH